MDLEVQVAAGAGGVAGFAHEPNRLALPQTLPAPHRGRPREVGIEVGAPLAFAVDQQVVAVEDWIEAAPQDPTVAHRDQSGAAGGGDVEAFVDAAAAARRVEFANRSPYPMRTLHREDVAVIGRATGAAADLGEGRRGRQRQGEDDESGGAPQ